MNGEQRPRRLDEDENAKAIARDKDKAEGVLRKLLDQ